MDGARFSTLSAMSASRRGHRYAPRGKTALGAILAAVAIAAGCGSDDPEPAVEETTPVESVEATPPPEEPAKGKPSGSRASAEKPVKPAKVPDRGKPEQGNRPGGGGSPDPADQSCPDGLDAQQCEAFNDAAENSNQLEDGECFSSMSAEECEELREAYENSDPDRSHEMKDGECYAALSKQECEELAEAAGG
jgi:hypothetical protein